MPGTLFSVLERVVKFDHVVSFKAPSVKVFCFPECSIAFNNFDFIADCIMFMRSTI